MALLEVTSPEGPWPEMTSHKITRQGESPTFGLLIPVASLPETSLSVTSHPLAMLLRVMSNGTFCTTTIVRKKRGNALPGMIWCPKSPNRRSLCIYPGLWLALYRGCINLFFSFFFFFIKQHVQQVITQNSVQWTSLPRDFLRAWWRLSCYVLHIDSHKPG
jgi:hypothetical protein